MYESKMSYKTVKIPEPLADQIDLLINDKEENTNGFTSRADFVKSAIRDLLHKLKSMEAKT